MKLAKFERVACALATVAVCMACIATHRLEADTIREDVFPISAGWNLIHVPGKPLESNIDLVLASIAWESVWTWLPPLEVGGQGRWLARYATGPAFLHTLRSFSGPASYASTRPPRAFPGATSALSNAARTDPGAPATTLPISANCRVAKPARHSVRLPTPARTPAPPRRSPPRARSRARR